MELKIYKMNDCDWVMSHLNKEETNSWYNDLYADNELEEVKECFLGGFWDEYSKESFNNLIISGEDFQIKKERGNYYRYLRFCDVVEDYKINGGYHEPFIIATTEI